MDVLAASGSPCGRGTNKAAGLNNINPAVEN
jgi:hypothetical protein